MFVLNEKPLAPDSPFTHNGVQYPANWLRLSSWEEKAAIGISEVPDPTPVDTRFYWDHGIPKQLEDDVDSETGRVNSGLKTQWKREQNQTAYNLLASTDWYVVRKLEVGIDVPVDIISFRTEVRNICQQRKVAINSATDVPALIDITSFSGLDWPVL